MQARYGNGHEEVNFDVRLIKLIFPGTKLWSVFIKFPDVPS